MNRCFPAARSVRRLIVVLSLAVFLSTAAAADEGRIVDVFDGKSLDGWTRADGQPVTKGWSVSDGVLMRNGKGGGAIYLPGEYGDFEFRFSWKMPERGNSGVKYRVAWYEKGVRGRPGWLGCEYQLLGVRSGKGSKGSTGAIYSLYAPSKEAKQKGPDEFNDSRIVVRDGRIEHWLNGEKICQADTNSEEWRERIAQSKFSTTDGFFRNPTGRIQFQDHGSPVWFKDLELRVFDAE